MLKQEAHLIVQELVAQYGDFGLYRTIEPEGLCWIVSVIQRGTKNDVAPLWERLRVPATAVYARLRAAYDVLVDGDSEDCIAASKAAVLLRKIERALLREDPLTAERLRPLYTFLSEG